MKKRAKQLLVTAGAVAVVTASSITSTYAAPRVSNQPVPTGVHQTKSVSISKKKSGDRLAGAVSAGTITQAQANLIAAKREELRTFNESLIKLSPDDRKLALNQKRTEIKKWATENNVPLELVGFGIKKTRGH
jgi:hypothetical protein